MKTTINLIIFFFIVSLNLLRSQVMFELDSTLQLNNLDTVTQTSDLFDLTRIESKELSVKPPSQSASIEGLQFVEYSPNFEDYGANYEKAHYYKHEDVVYLGGLVRRISGGPYLAGDILFVLPNSHRPKFRILATAIQNNSLLRVDVKTNGEVTVVTTSANTIDFLDLSGISFRTPSLYLGQEIGGGYLFHIADPPVDLDGDGIVDIGLVSAHENYIGYTWGCYGTFTGVTGDYIGAGFFNTQDILQICTDPNIISKIVSDLIYQGFNDWYLPSKSELDLMWDVLADSDGDGLNSGLSDPGNIGNFINNFYISSTDLSTNVVRGVSFAHGSVIGLFKDINYYFKPIRILKSSDL